ncbi:MAG: phosphatidate cytidylyltransferase [Campylobacteraceae bacterium]|nr:phosphatidate cytidylyltransferase [Campylobacteraceae bacterium]
MSIKDIYNSHKDRILTGFALLFIVLVIVVIDNLFITWLFFGVVYLIAFYEAMELFAIKDSRFFVYAIALWLAALVYPNPDDLIYIVLIIVISIMAHTKEVNFKLIAPILYPSASMLFLLALYKDFGMSSLVWLVAIVASSDVGAYIVGKSIGKRAFSKTSPNKTWEGTIGGIVIATVLGSLVGLSNVDIGTSIFVSFFVALCAVWGDLFESYLKREAGIKDSGTIFPGHGGMLDRCDGYMFAGVIMTVLLRGLL